MFSQKVLFWASFIIFVIEHFYSNYNVDFASYADDTTPYIYGQDFSEIVKGNSSTGSFKMVFQQTQARVTNRRRFQKANGPVITSSSSEELLGVLTDSEHTFHITRLYFKANQNLLHWLDFSNI